MMFCFLPAVGRSRHEPGGYIKLVLIGFPTFARHYQSHARVLEHPPIELA